MCISKRIISYSFQKKQCLQDKNKDSHSIDLFNCLCHYQDRSIGGNYLTIHKRNLINFQTFLNPLWSRVINFGTSHMKPKIAYTLATSKLGLQNFIHVINNCEMKGDFT